MPLIHSSGQPPIKSSPCESRHLLPCITHQPSILITSAPSSSRVLAKSRFRIKKESSEIAARRRSKIPCWGISAKHSPLKRSTGLFVNGWKGLRWVYINHRSDFLFAVKYTISGCWTQARKKKERKKKEQTWRVSRLSLASLVLQRMHWFTENPFGRLQQHSQVSYASSPSREIAVRPTPSIIHYRVRSDSPSNSPTIFQEVHLTQGMNSSKERSEEDSLDMKWACKGRTHGLWTWRWENVKRVSWGNIGINEWILIHSTNKQYWRLTFLRNKKCFWKNVKEKIAAKENYKYRQPGLICTPQSFAQSSKYLGKEYFFGPKVTSKVFLSISQNLKDHTPSVRHTNKTLNSLTKLRSFKVTWTFFGAHSWLCCTPVDGLTKNVVKQNV